MWKFVAYQMEPRSALYEVAATLFSYPPASDTLVSLGEQLSSHQERLNFWDDPLLAAASENLLKALSMSWTPAEIQADYKLMFGPKAINSETSFRECGLSGFILRDIRSEYESWGFHKAGWFGGSDDHVAVECVFMALMRRDFISMAQDAGVNPSDYVGHLERQYGFLTAHPLQWIPRWAECKREFPVSGLYESAARLTAILVKTDSKRLLESMKLIRACGYNNYSRERRRTVHTGMAACGHSLQ